MAEVEILEVLREPVAAELFWGAGVDLPAPGARHEHFGLIIGGWVLHRDTDRLDVEIWCGDRLLSVWQANLERLDVASAFGETPVNPACGFLGVVRTVDLPRQFELRIEAVAGYDRAVLGRIRGKRSALVNDTGARLRPAVIVTLGRTGSTLLMQLLGHHPSAVVHPPFPFETRVLGYWVSVFERLSSPSSYLQALASIDTRRYWWVGFSAFRAETYLDQDGAAQWLGGASLEATATFARNQVASFYEASAALQGKVAEAQYFVEKQVPNSALQAIQAELFPERREIYLVREPRDMLSSILAFNAKRGYVGFGGEVRPGVSQVEELGRAVDELLTAWRRAGNQCLLVRYEDLVESQSGVLEKILGFLGLESSNHVTKSMIADAARADRAAHRAHRTTSSWLASIGRWRRDLPPALAERCQSAFEAALAEWGYES